MVNGTTARDAYAPHLLLREVALDAGKEWAPPATGWCLVQVGGGTAYWLQGQSRLEMDAGSLLLTFAGAKGSILASCLNGISLRFFTVMPERLSGVISQGEQDLLRGTADKKISACQLFNSSHPLPSKMTALCGQAAPKGLSFRVSLLQLWAEALGAEMDRTLPDVTHTDVRERLRAFLLETPASALLEMSFEQLAKTIRCTPRHLSRVFAEVNGVSFREKRAEIRLARARELLATSESKVVDVAFRSGYKSLSLFNRVFTRQFGLSPGRWRQKNGDTRRNDRPRLGVRVRLGA
jgi:AraC-like DNA-binding protein